MTNVPALLLIAVAAAPAAVMVQDLPPHMVAGWEAYVAENDRQVAAEEAASSAFLAQDIYDVEEARRCKAEVLAGDVCIVKVVLVRDGRFPVEVEDALVHHWVGSIFVPGATLERTLEFIKAYDRYPQYFEEVADARVLGQDGDTLRSFMRLKRTKVITVHFNSEHEVTFTRHGPRRASSRSVATRIRELDRAGEADEREKEPSEDQGLLWRLNANWKYEEVDGGVILEAEVISLSRRIPWGLGWIVGPFVDSVPRESLESTLTTLRAALSSPADRSLGQPTIVRSSAASMSENTSGRPFVTLEAHGGAPPATLESWNDPLSQRSPDEQPLEKHTYPPMYDISIFSGVWPSARSSE